MKYLLGTPYKKITFMLVLLLANLAAHAEQLAADYQFATRYDVAGRVTGTIAPDPDYSGPLGFPAVRNTYNALGLLEKIETGELAVWQNEFTDPINWTNFTVYTTKAMTYDQYGRLETTKILDKYGSPKALKQLSYDTLNRVDCSSQRMNPDSYNSLPQNACTIGPASAAYGQDRITKYTYNDLDLVTQEDRGWQASLSATYVTNTYVPYTRLLSTQVDAIGNKTSYFYDEHRRLKRIVYPVATRNNPQYPLSPGASNGTETGTTGDYVEFHYDNNGNKTWERKRNGAIINYGYDNNNRLILKDFTDNTKQKDVYYDYELRGLMLSARFDSINGEGITNSYDGFGNRITSTNNMGGVTRTLTSGYDFNNNREKVKHPSGWTINYSFDGLNRLQSVKDENLSSWAPAQIVITYQRNGRDRNISRLGGGSGGYTYNDLGQLENITQSFAYEGSSTFTNTFKYNPAGQITELTQNNSLYFYSGNENRVGAYVPDGLNRYSSIAGQAMNYDGSSNLTYDGVQYYSYDDENRLIGTSGGVAIMYDPLGRLFQTTINGSATQFLYDGDALAAEYVNGTLTKSYAHGDQVDEPLLQITGSTVTNYTSANFSYFIADHQGSVIARMSNEGKSVQTIAYDVYGIPTIKNAAPNDRFGYTGQLWFKEMGLYYYKARMYHPKLGRFLQTDPIGYKDDYDLYSYVGNDPVNKTDPTGLKGNCRTIDAGGGYSCDYTEASDSGTSGRPRPSTTPVDAFKPYAEAMGAALEEVLKDYLTVMAFALPELGVAAKSEKVVATAISFTEKLTAKSTPGISANITKPEAIKNVVANGFKQSAKNENVYTNENKTYTFYNSTGGGIKDAPVGIPSASYFIDGILTGKVRFLEL